MNSKGPGSEISWGIIAPGHIAHKFAAAMTEVDDSRVLAVASRDSDRAADFAGRFSIERSYSSYRDLTEDPDIDAVYIASPNSLHLEHSLMAIGAGKAVLCEKPLALNVSQAEKIVAAAKEQSTFLMEGMWTRFLPAVRKAVEHVASGEIGVPRRIEGDFSFDIPRSPDHRLNQPELGGGALLDTGVYLLHMLKLFVPEDPRELRSVVEMGESGVDLQTAMLMSYPSGLIASLSCGIRTDGPRNFRVIGSDGTLEIPGPFFSAESAVINSRRGQRKIRGEFRKNGFEFEIEQVNRCLRRGLTAHPLLPPGRSVEVAELMDRVRADWPSD